MPISLPLYPQSYELEVEQIGDAWLFTHANDDEVNTDDISIQHSVNPTALDERFYQVEEESPPLSLQQSIWMR